MKKAGVIGGSGFIASDIISQKTVISSYLFILQILNSKPYDSCQFFCFYPLC